MLDIKLIERGLEKPGKTKGGLADGHGRSPGRGFRDPVRDSPDQGIGNRADHGISAS